MTAVIMDLFASPPSPATIPLAERMRPRTLDDVIGQESLTGETGLLRQVVASGDLPSLILWGPPGSGKTTLARVLATLTHAPFEPFSAVLGGVKEVRDIVARAHDRRRASSARTLLFVDEIHRFNKAQQDAFLPHVEDGTLILIGATTENPSFALNAALLSRCRVLRLAPLPSSALTDLLARAVTDPDHGLTHSTPFPPETLAVLIPPDVLAALADLADGDARRALNDLEILASTLSPAAPSPVTLSRLTTLLGRGPLRHDRDGDAHYDLASALIKSLRGSDPDAALYYLARLLEAGDDPRFLLRRLIIFASEDIGNADPRALGLAVDGLQAFQLIGMPEGRIVLGQVVTYLATAPKSNASYLAIDEALATARRLGSLPVPMHLRNAPTSLMKDLGHGEGYRYPHDHGGWVPDHYLPDRLRGTTFYNPSSMGYEQQLAQRLERWRRLRADPSTEK